MKTIRKCWLFIRKYWFHLLCFFILFVIAIPLLINWLYKQPAICPLLAMEWEAEDALGFYGTFLGAAATIAGVYLSIKYAQKNYREDARNRIRPYMALTYIRSRFKTNFLDTCLSNNRKSQTENYYEEFRLSNIYIILEKDGIKYNRDLTESQKAVLAQGGGKWEGTDKLKRFIVSDYISIPFEADNVGNGAAINLTLCFNRLNPKAKRGCHFFTIMPNSSIYFHIFSEADADDVLGEYLLELFYHDIEGTYYSQKYPVVIKRHNNSVVPEVDFTGAQEIVQEEHQNDQIKHGNPGSDRPEH